MMTPVIGRKEFVGLLAALAAMRCSPPARHDSSTSENTSQPTAAAQTPAAKAFSERLFDDVARTFAVALAYIGDQLGLFTALSRIGACSPADLAAATKLHLRLVREWLDGMVAAGYVAYTPEGGLYHLPADRTTALVDDAAPEFSAGLVNLAVPLVMASRPVIDSFRTGRPLTPDAFHADLWRGLERYSSPLYRHRLVQQWLSALPQTVKTLNEGGTLVDVGCGAGRAAITMAAAFPKARIAGVDPYPPAIERARENAAAAGLARRLTFTVGGARDLPPQAFDVITSFDVVHHYADPVGELTAVRRALTADGTYLIFDAAISPNIAENGTAWGTFLYGSSVLYCLHDSLANGGAGLGADFSEPRVRDVAQRAGFQRFRRVASSDPTEAIYELKA